MEQELSWHVASREVAHKYETYGERASLIIYLQQMCFNHLKREGGALELRLVFAVYDMNVVCLDVLRLKVCPLPAEQIPFGMV